MKNTLKVGLGALIALPLVAAAQVPGLNPPPLPKPNPRADISIPAKIEPVEAPPSSFLHHLKLRLDAGTGVKRSKDTDLPGRTETDDANLTLEFRAGERGFGAVSLGTADSASRTRNSVANGAIWIDGNMRSDTYRLTGGYYVLPFLALGASVGRYDNSGGFQYNLPVPRTNTTGNGPTYSLFAFGFMPLPARQLLLTFGAGYHKSNQDFSFANNVPPNQRSESEIMTADIGLMLPLAEGLTMRTGLTLNHTVSQTVLPGGVPALDNNWLAGSVGLTYKINKSFEVNAGYSGWLNSNKNEYSRASVGLGYRF